jgi:DNA polymerase-3 subunit epsilon
MVAKLAARLCPGAAFGAPADLGRPLAEVPFVVLDTETTGVREGVDEILEVGAVRMVGGRVLIGQTFHRLVRPGRNGWGPTVPIHRIRPADVAAAPPIEAVLPELVAFCREAVIVGHKVGFDRAFLKRAGFPVGRFRWVDIDRVEGWLEAQAVGGPPGADPVAVWDLEALARRYGVELFRPHSAPADALAAAQVWQRQLTRLEGFGVRTLGDLLLAVGAR